MRRPAVWVPLALAVVLAGVYAGWAPHTADLAAQAARAQLFRRSGLVPYWAGWYGGSTTVSYSLLSPPLLGWLGPVALGALTVVATTAVAIPLLAGAVRPTAAGIAVAAVSTLDVVSGRTTFALGGVLLVAALLAIRRDRTAVTAVLAVIATAASPVAGVLLLVIAVGIGLARPDRRIPTLAAVVGVVATLGVLAALARTDSAGYQPFSASSLFMAIGTALVIAVSPVGRVMRTVALVAVGALVLTFAVHSGIGANITRLAVLGAAPVLVATARLSRRAVAVPVALACLLPLAQLTNDLAAASHDDGSRSFVAALRSELAALPTTRNHRVELVDTGTHWPSTYLVPDVTLARGWERQVDEARNPAFYGRAPLTAASYRRYLDQRGVAVVAVAHGVPLDSGCRLESALIGGGLPYLRRVWGNLHWTVYAVAHPAPLASPPATVQALTDTGMTLRVPRGGAYPLRLRWSPFLSVPGGIIRRDRQRAVAVLPRAGRYQVEARWSI